MAQEVVFDNVELDFPPVGSIALVDREEGYPRTEPTPSTAGKWACTL